MTKKPFAIALLGAAATLVLLAQSNVIIDISKAGGKGTIAIPDFRGTGDAQRFMGTFNQTLWSEIDQSGAFKMAPKTFYPLQVPQTAQDFKPGGPSLTDWSGPPVNATYLAFGYTAVKDNQLVLFGWLYNVSENNLASAQLIGKVYFGTVDDAGAKKVAQDFAADILKQFNLVSLAGSKIIFVSQRTGTKEIWMMDYDGSNQRDLTRYHSITTMPSVSPDGANVAYTSFAHGRPEIMIQSLETGRHLVFYNQSASMNAQLSYFPDGKSVVFSSTASGGYAQIYKSNANGSGLQRISNARAVEVEPKVNPRTGSEIVFVSGRSGPQQLYIMNADGANVQRLTDGTGEASNPCWSPDGRFIAFAWTRGFEPGNFNIFIMDVASREYTQLTHGVGRNENPTWAPDGRHLVFCSRRGGGFQIFTMLADGTQVKQLTTQGQNTMPVWTK
jgi:TolB protein